jgi:hypothetical protein
VLRSLVKRGLAALYGCAVLEVPLASLGPSMGHHGILAPKAQHFVIRLVITNVNYATALL